MVDMSNRGPELQAVCSTFVSLAFIATVLRVYVRTRLVKAFGWDDMFMVLALLAYVMFATCAISGIHWGTGRHMAELSEEQQFKAMRYWWLCYVAYAFSMIFSKTSIGLFLLRVTIKPIHKWIIYCAMGITVLTGLVFFFVTLLQCSPISFFWTRFTADAPKDGFCVDINIIIALTFLYSGCAIISDFTFALLPFFLIKDLNMPLRAKVMLIPVLGMACIASIAVTVRLGYVLDFRNPDFLYATIDVAIWSDIEQGLAITAGSLATLRPLYRQLASTLGFSTGMPEPESRPTGMRTPQWSPPISSARKQFPSFKSLLRSENRTVGDREEEYGMGDLQPVRLRDDLVGVHENEKSDKGFTTWAVHTAKTSDESCRAGEITRQTHVHQASEWRK